MHGVNSIDSALGLLIAGREDVFLDTPIVALSMLKKDEFKNSGIRVLEPAVGVLNVYTYFNKNYANLVDSYLKALKEIKAVGTYQRIM